MNAQAHRRRLPYTWIVVGVFGLMGAVWLFGSRGNAQVDSDNEKSTDAETFVTLDVLSRSVRRELGIQRREHEQRLEELRSLKQRLEDADADDRQIEAVDELIEEENRGYEARREQLVRWQQAAEERKAATDEELEDEQEDLVRAVARLNQSYVVPPVVGHGSATGGSVFIDRDDDLNAPDTRLQREDEPPPPRNDDESAEDQAADGDQPEETEPAQEHAKRPIPDWLLGEVRRDQPLDRRARIREAHELSEAGLLNRMMREIERLRGEVERLKAERSAD